MNKGIQRGSEESESLQPAKRTPEEEEEDGGRGIGREGKGEQTAVADADEAASGKSLALPPMGTRVDSASGAH